MQDFTQFKKAVDYASDHIIITDQDGFVLYANKAAEETTGFKMKEMLGKTPSIWGKQMDLKFYKDFWNVIKFQKKEYKGRITNKRKNGEIYIADIYVTPVLNNKGDVDFFIGIERDITNELAIDRAKMEFINMTSHQLKTPITITKWYLESFMQDHGNSLTPEQRQLIKVAYHANLRLKHLVHNLLSVSKIELGDFPYYRQKTDLIKLIKSNIIDLEDLIKKMDIKLKLKSTSKIPSIFTDSNFLSIVIQNILTNAIKYNKKGGTIQISVTKLPKTKTKPVRIKMQFKDSGIGISKADQEKVFDKYFRSKKAIDKDPDGSGLGLYLTEFIVKKMGGEISLSSIINNGTTINLIMPLDYKINHQ